MPKKNFTAGSVLRAADVNEYLTSSWNAIINGAFEINQRGLTSTTSAVYGFDRWTSVYSTSTTTYSSQTFTPGTAPVVGYEGSTFARLATSGQTGTGGRANIIQFIENVRTFAGQTVTLSFWAKAASGTPNISVELAQEFGSGGSAGVYGLGGKITLTGGTNWTRYTKTIALPALTGKTIGANSTLTVILWTSAGSGYDSRTGALGLQNITVDFWGVQLEEGSAATPFRRSSESFAGELAACYRYCQIVDNWNGIGEGTTNIAATFPFHTEMRIAPTIVTALTSNQLSLRTTAGGDYDLTGWGATAPTVSSRGMWVLLTGMTGLADNQAYTMRYIGTGKDGLFRLEAEL